MFVVWLYFSNLRLYHQGDICTHNHNGDHEVSIIHPGLNSRFNTGAHIYGYLFFK